MAGRDFGLVRYEFKRVDGKGKVLVAHQTPSALVRATRDSDGLNPFEAAALLAYYSAQAAGILEATRIKWSAKDSELDRALKFLDLYQFREVPLDDDGNPVSDKEPGAEPDPTGPRTPASAS